MRRLVPCWSRVTVLAVACVRCRRRRAGVAVSRDHRSIARGHEPVGRAAGRRERVRDPMADQARGLPDQGEPHLRPHVRHGSPGRAASRSAWTTACGGRSMRGTDQATYEDIPHCYDCALRRVERRRDGRVQPERLGRAVGVHAAAQGSAAQLLAVGEGVRAVRQLLRERARAVVPEPPVLDRGAVGRRARQPASPAGPRFAHVRLRRAAGAARGGRRQRGRRRSGCGRASTS